jgi:hypothetical protein
MAFKRRKVNYRKIYEEHHGPIPIDANGRKYDIHHIDGNHENNLPENLKAISVQEHYDLHYKQGDYYECYLIMIQRLSKTPEEISAIATLNNLKRVKEGTNPLVGGELQKKSSREYWEKMGDNHPAAISSRERVKNGTHHLLGGGPTHPGYDFTTHKFHNIKTEETVTMTQNEFFKKYDLHSGAVSDLVNRKRNVSSVKDWVLVDPKTDNPIIRENLRKDTTLYKFKNKHTNETVLMTREQFKRTFNTDPKDIVTGKRKSANGWQCVKYTT